ncbi:hypothetical protein [Halocynthiibacter namhaensis]|uniref:hypothetical protein n=1 Tax=Halocynthiibacter namhaensis TaxID=1290553 RepID=UPI0005796A33|nr:hypothetical protein [Halocynthiibacter namhaensis]
MTKKKRDQTEISIRDQFMRNIGENGGDVSTAFVDVLNVIDQRLQKSTNAVSAAEDTFDRLATWYDTANAKLQKMPVELNDNLAQGLRRELPELTLQVKRDAQTGARNGATLAQGPKR